MIETEALYFKTRPNGLRDFFYEEASDDFSFKLIAVQNPLHGRNKQKFISVEMTMITRW